MRQCLAYGCLFAILLLSYKGIRRDVGQTSERFHELKGGDVGGGQEEHRGDYRTTDCRHSEIHTLEGDAGEETAVDRRDAKEVLSIHCITA